MEIIYYKIDLVDNWDYYLSFFKNGDFDVYFEEKYVKLYESDVDKAACFVCNFEDKYLLFPFLRNDIIHEGERFYEIKSPYGYGGPISNVQDAQFVETAMEHFFFYCENNNYITCFIRLHPLLGNHRCFNQVYSCKYNRKTVAIDLQPSVDDIWMHQISTKNRNVLRHTFKDNFRFIADYDYFFIDDFIRLYMHTMDRKESDSFYHFSKSYFYKFKKQFKDSFLAVVIYNEVIVSASIIFYSTDYGHYHLSAWDLNYSPLNSNKFLIWEVAKFLKSLNVKLFHLGGGTDSNIDNSLFKFKKKFSKNKYDFYICNMTFKNTLNDSFRVGINSK